MRQLEFSDIFQGSRLLKALGLKEQARELASKADNLEDIWNNGFDFVWNLFDSATETGGERAIYTFLAGPFEMTPEEIEHMPFRQLISHLKQLARENDLLDFFRGAAELMK